jgi:predicted alpha-1,6-mannanase (GH76 family)
MKKTITLSLLFCLALTAFAQETKDKAYWSRMADGMVQALIKNFWGANFKGYGDRYYFNYGSNLSDMSTHHYWPQAHAMDVLVDAYMRTGDSKYKELYPLWWIGAPKFNNGPKKEDPWWNPYVDDMEWISLALIRMFVSCGNKDYIAKARQLYDNWIWPTWGPENEAPWYGGITWKTDVSKSKNACSNGPAAIIAARLYQFYDKAGFKDGKKRDAYLAEAVKIYTWLKRNLYDPQTGAIRDNMNLEGKVNPAVYTYNPGTFIGAAHELYQITGNKQYIDDAIHAATYVMENMSHNDGVLSNSTKGDGGLFHGIFFRYFVKLINNKEVPTEVRKRFHAYLMHQATVMAEQGVNPTTMLYAGRWRQAPTKDEPVCLTPHLTGCMLMEAMTILEPVE